jgi:CDP-glucose 4,6-dehydratase
MKIKKIHNFYKNKKVLIIGHTGFKGSWLSISLKEMNARIYGISIDIPTKQSHFRLLKLNKKIKDFRLDIRNYNELKKKILSIKPDVIFHLAAQSLVKKSFADPYETWTTNLLGTINLFDILKNMKIKKNTSVVVITSDKCYKNLNQRKKYLETDLLGDSEPYGASKAAIELAFRSYFDSFFFNKKNLNIATARAGNVIGGGDWSQDRIIPDLIKSMDKKKTLKIRYPKSTRPWQHVLEPIYGYLFLGYNLHVKKPLVNGESFNFGPNFVKNYNVIDLLHAFKKYLPKINWKISKKKTKIKEANLLNLNSSKAKKILKWKNILSFDETVKMTASWYQKYFEKVDMNIITNNQIRNYLIKLNNIK